MAATATRDKDKAGNKIGMLTPGGLIMLRTGAPQ